MIASWRFGLSRLVPATRQTPPTAPAAAKPAERRQRRRKLRPCARGNPQGITGALGWKVGIPANAFSQLTFLERRKKPKLLA